MVRRRRWLALVAALLACVGVAASVAGIGGDRLPEGDRMPAQARPIVGHRTAEALGDGIAGLVRWNGRVVARGRVARDIDLQTRSFRVLSLAGVGTVVDVAQRGDAPIALVQRAEGAPLVLVIGLVSPGNEPVWEGHELPAAAAFPAGGEPPTLAAQERAITVSSGPRSFVLEDDKWVEAEPEAWRCRLGGGTLPGTLVIGPLSGGEGSFLRPALAWEDHHFRVYADGHLWDLGPEPAFLGHTLDEGGRLLAMVATRGVVRRERDGEWTWLTPGWPEDERATHVLDENGTLVIATAARTVALFEEGAPTLRWIRASAAYERANPDALRDLPLTPHATVVWTPGKRQVWREPTLGPLRDARHRASSAVPP